MKNKLFILSIFILFLISNCKNKKKFTNLFELNDWIFNNIEYKTDKKNYDYWQTPSETLKLQTGDCEDMAILFQHLAKQYLKKNVVLLLVKGKNDTFNHMSVLSGMLVYEPTNGKVYRFKDYIREYFIFGIILNDETNYLIYLNNENIKNKNN